MTVAREVRLFLWYYRAVWALALAVDADIAWHFLKLLRYVRGL